jgi:hypothetical protein
MSDLSGSLRLWLTDKSAKVVLEWMDPTEQEDGYGLAEYADRLPGAALDILAAEAGSCRPFLAGHSLG